MGAGWLGWSGYATGGCQNDCADCRRPLFAPVTALALALALALHGEEEQSSSAAEAGRYRARLRGQHCRTCPPSFNHSSRPFLCLFHPHTCTGRLFSALRPSSASPAQLCRLITALSAAEPYACPTLPPSHPSPSPSPPPPSRLHHQRPSPPAVFIVSPWIAARHGVPRTRRIRRPSRRCM